MNWQEILYPLGLLSSIFFTSRVIYQWTLSEKSGSSESPKGFWILSLGGHGVHLIHSILQMQLPLALVQACNLVIARRNLNLIQPTSIHLSLIRVIIHFVLLVFLTLFCYLALCYFQGEFIWMRAPTFPIFGLTPKTPSIALQTLGLIGIILYSSRFWVQWVTIERSGKSYLGPSFWIVSLLGAILSTIYFIAIYDWINILGTGFTLIPYIRNLLFIYRKKVAYE
jgi:lipid-A-disaccharide synthase-like uncharacterized protein